jgi:hypothetical protein
MARLRTVFAIFLLLFGLAAGNQNLLAGNPTGDFASAQPTDDSSDVPVSETVPGFDFCSLEGDAVLPSPELTESASRPAAKSPAKKNFNSLLFFIPASALLAQTGQPPRAG